MNTAPTAMQIEVAVAAVARDGDRILLIERGNEPSKGRWTLPGGRVQPGEALHDAVRREVMEETAVAVTRVVRLLDVVERIGDGRHFVILDYLVEVETGCEAVAGDDAADARWVPRSAMGALPLTSRLEEFLTAHGV